MPDFLWGDAREEWERVVPELTRLGLTKPADVAALTGHCLAYQRLAQAQRRINEDGMLHTNSQGVVRHPMVAIVEAASKELRSWAVEFGLTPSSEQRVARPEDQDHGDADPFGEGAAHTG